MTPRRVLIILFISMALASGSVWGPDTRLTNNDSLSYFGFPTMWAIAADNRGWVHVVWDDQRDPQWCSEVYYKRSTDNGKTWGPDTPLTTNSNYWQEMSCIVADRFGLLHVVYTEFYYSGPGFLPIVHYKRSTDGGNTWSGQVNLDTLQGDFAGHTSLASDLKNGVYVLFANQTGPTMYNLDNYFIGSTNGGKTWGTTKRLTNSQAALWGSIAGDTLGRVHICYPDGRTGARQLYYRRSTDMGKTFEPEVILTTGSSNKFNPSIYTDRGDRIYIVWQDNRDGNYEVYYIRSTDGGTTWGSETRLTNDPNDSQEANITCDLSNGVYIVWNDNRAGYGVYFKESTDGGNTWSSDTCLTNGAVPDPDQFFPNIACSESGEYLHVAWKDKRDGNLEVYYKRRAPAPRVQDNFRNRVPSENVRISPNPAVDKVSINYHLTKPDQVVLQIYDSSGRIIKTLDKGYKDSGEHQIVWDGCDHEAKRVSSGVYFVRLRTDKSDEFVRFVLVR